MNNLVSTDMWGHGGVWRFGQIENKPTLKKQLKIIIGHICFKKIFFTHVLAQLIGLSL